MILQKAVLKSFNATGYVATVQVTGSQTAYLEDVAVARNIPSAEMVAGRNLAVMFFDEHNAREAVVIAVYT
ncbi:MAG: hypothetical protein V1780_04320 [Chloroflexota bacterium]